LLKKVIIQIATPETVLVPFDPITLEARGRPYRLERRGDTFWIELDDPDWQPQRSVTPLWNASQRFRLVENPAMTPPRVERRGMMITGSHHQQRYWLASGKGNRLDLLPFAYLIAEKRWFASTVALLLTRR